MGIKTFDSARSRARTHPTDQQIVYQKIWMWTDAATTTTAAVVTLLINNLLREYRKIISINTD